MKSSRPGRDDRLEQGYRQRYAVLKRVAVSLQELIAEYLKDQPRIDRISARAKDIDSFMTKARKKEKNKYKYADPLAQIQDQVGVRIVTFFASDVGRLDEIVKRYFRSVEFKDRVPDSEWEFGYFGRHYILIMPEDVIDDVKDRSSVPNFFELQVKTLFQHAWSEAEHDLGYKPGETPLTREQNRRLAFTSAQAWGADHTFDDLFLERQSDASPAYLDGSSKAAAG